MRTILILLAFLQGLTFFTANYVYSEGIYYDPWEIANDDENANSVSEFDILVKFLDCNSEKTDFLNELERRNHLKELLKKANSGDMIAQYKFGLMNIELDHTERFVGNVPRDAKKSSVVTLFKEYSIQKGLTWLSKSVEQGYSPAMYELACYYSRYHKHSSFKYDLKGLYSLVERSARGGYSEAQYAMGLLTWLGYLQLMEGDEAPFFIDRDATKALKLLSTPASSAHIKSMKTYVSYLNEIATEEVFILLKNSFNDFLLVDDTVLKDDAYIASALKEEERKLFYGFMAKSLKDIKNKKGNAVHILIESLEKKELPPPKLKYFIVQKIINNVLYFKNSRRVIPSELISKIDNWLIETYDEGITQAAYLRYLLHRDGEGNEGKAFEILSLLVKKDRYVGVNGDAQFQLGLMYFNGQGVKQDNKKAETFFQIAKEKGHEQAGMKLDSLQNNVLKAQLLESRKEFETKLHESKKDFEAQLHNSRKEKDLYLLLLVSLSGLLLGLAAVIWGWRRFLGAARSKREGERQAHTEENSEQDFKPEKESSIDKSPFGFDLSFDVTEAKENEAANFAKELDKRFSNLLMLKEITYIHNKNNEIVSFKDNRINVNLMLSKKIYEIQILSYILNEVGHFFIQNNILNGNIIQYKVNGEDSKIDKVSSRIEKKQLVDKLTLKHLKVSFLDVITSLNATLVEERANKDESAGGNIDDFPVPGKNSTNVVSLLGWVLTGKILTPEEVGRLF